MADKQLYMKKYLHSKNYNLNDYLNQIQVETDCVYFNFPDDYYAFLSAMGRLSSTYYFLCLNIFVKHNKFH